MRRSACPITLVYTSSVSAIAGSLRPDVPVLVFTDGTGVIEPPSDWLRDRAVYNGSPNSTLRTYAEVAQNYWHYLHAADVQWDQVDDDVLIAWRDDQVARGLTRRTINFRLRAVFRFYLWAQARGLVTGLIGTPEWSEQGRTLLHPISVSVERIRGRQGGLRDVLCSNVLLKNVNIGTGRFIHTPSDAEMTRVYDELARGSEFTAERNTLMAAWAEQAGLRRKEFSALAVEQIPLSEEIARLYKGREIYLLELNVTKGGKRRRVPVTPDLLHRTRDFIDFERADLIASFRARSPNFQSPCHIFLSAKTGTQLNERAVTNIFTRAFRAAAVIGWTHRIRARYLTFITQRLFEIEYEYHGQNFNREAILLRVAEIAGHANIQSLRPYLDLVVKRHFETDRAYSHMARELHDLTQVRRLQRALTRHCNLKRLTAILGSESKAVSVLRLITEAHVEAACIDLSTTAEAE